MKTDSAKTKTFIEVDEDAMEMLDKYIHGVYSTRCRLRNQASIGDDGRGWFDHEFYDQVKFEVEYNIKPLAKKFGLYPYNQSEYWEDGVKIIKSHKENV